MINQAVAKDVVEFTGVRVTHRSALSFDQVLANLRARVGETTVANIVEMSAGTGSRVDFEKKVQHYVGESGFMLFAEMDHGRWIAKYDIKRRVLRWIIGNPLIAITMLRYDQIAGLFLPVELLLAEEDGDKCSVTYVLPSSLVVIGENAELLRAATALDDKLETLVVAAVGG